MAPLKLFAIGATGYIGGSALNGIYKRHPDWQVSALVRSPKDDAAVSKAFGDARIVRGSFSDLDLIRSESAAADFVLNCADADNMEVVQAILEGMKERSGKQGEGGRKPVLVHTSGTSVVKVGGDGTFVDANKVNDNVPEDIKSIGIDQPHRKIDLAIMEANDSHPIDCFIIAPSAIYGEGTGPVRKLTAQIPELVRTAVKRQQVVHVGPGANVWNFVHIEDLEELYGLVGDLAVDDAGKAKAQSGAERFYFGSADEQVWGEVVKALAPIMKARGKVPIDTVGSVSLAEEPGVSGYFSATATNSRSKADRGKALGWKPRDGGVWGELEKTVDMTIKEFAL